MAYHLSRYEQETIVLFNEEEPTAIITTANGTWKRKLKELAATRPAEVTERTLQDPFMEYIVPKEWIRVKLPRVLSEKQLEASLRTIAEARKYKK